MKAKAVVDGKEVSGFPFTAVEGGALNIQFELYKREWRINEEIEITPQECQFVAMSLSMLGNQLLADFEREMNEPLGVGKAGGVDSVNLGP